MSNRKTEKYCGGCDTLKATSEFYNQKGRSDGLSSQCKECQKARSRQYHKAHAAQANARAKEWRARNKGYKNAYDRQWRKANAERKKQTDKLHYERNKDRILEQTREYLVKRLETDPDFRNRIGKAYRLRHYSHRRAQEVVSEAIKAGKLPPARECSCVICGETAKEYHHWSYQREHWLDVIPLCVTCHNKQDVIRKKSTD